MVIMYEIYIWNFIVHLVLYFVKNMCIEWLQYDALSRLHICFVKISHFHCYLINIFLIYGYTVYTQQQDIFLTFIILVSG